MSVRIWRKGNRCARLAGMQIGAAIVENSMEGSQKAENRNTMQLSNSTSGIHPKPKPKPLMFIAALFKFPRHGRKLSDHQQING